jgi:hypothetical protein
LATVEGYPQRLDTADQFIAEIGPYASPTIVFQYNAELDLGRRTILRNDIITARLYAVDANFNQFVRELTTQQNLGAVAADWTAIALAGAGSVTGSASTKAVLAAITGSVIGAKAAVDKDVFYNKAIPTLVTTMEGQRKLVLVRIYAGLQKSAAEYPLFQALADVDNYYAAGTVNGALVGLTTAAGIKSQEGDVQIAAVLTSDFSYDDPSQKLRKFWKPDGAINFENQNKIKAWMRASRLNIDDISSLLYMEAYRDARARAVRELNIQ